MTMEFNNENELDEEFEDLTEDADANTPDGEDEEELEDADDGESKEPQERQFTKFVELTDAEYNALPLTERRKYVKRLETSRKRKKQAAVRDRKRAQRKREKAGVVTGLTNRIEASWKENLADVQSNPARTAEFAELKERLVNFNYIRQEARAVIDRIRQGVHPEATGPGRFYECIAADYLEHAKRYGLGEYNPPFLIVMKLETKFHAHRAEALQKLKDDPAYRYRINLGLDIDHVNNLEFYSEFFSAFFTWYLDNRQRPDYDYDFSDADILVNEFEIPAKLLAPPFDGGVWTRLDNYRRRVSDEPYRVKTAAEILLNDAKVLKELKDLGY
jgi:hypothetical protein